MERQAQNKIKYLSYGIAFATEVKKEELLLAMTRLGLKGHIQKKNDLQDPCWEGYQLFKTHHGRKLPEGYSFFLSPVRIIQDDIQCREVVIRYEDQIHQRASRKKNSDSEEVEPQSSEPVERLCQQCKQSYNECDHE